MRTSLLQVTTCCRTSGARDRPTPLPGGLRQMSAAQTAQVRDACVDGFSPVFDMRRARSVDVSPSTTSPAVEDNHTLQSPRGGTGGVPPQQPR